MATKKTTKTKAPKSIVAKAQFCSAEAKTEQPSATNPAKAKAAAKPKKVSALSAAAQVLAGAEQPLTCPELIVAMAAQGAWTSPKGLTPAATLYAALTREIKTKGADSRFRKADRGKFALNAVK